MNEQANPSEQLPLSSEQHILVGTNLSNALKTLAVFGGGLAATAVVYLIVYLVSNAAYANIAGIVMLLLGSFCVNYLSRFTRTEFDYDVFKGKFEITKIMGRTKRKNYITFSAPNIVSLRPYSAEALAALNVPRRLQLDASSRLHYDLCWLAEVDVGTGHNVAVIIEPTEETMALMRRHLNPQKIKE